MTPQTFLFCKLPVDFIRFFVDAFTKANASIKLNGYAQFSVVHGSKWVILCLKLVCAELKIQ